MRVYVPTTLPRLAGLRSDGLPAGTEGYAVTDALADALDLPRPGRASPGDHGHDQDHGHDHGQDHGQDHGRGPHRGQDLGTGGDRRDDDAAEDLEQAVLDAAAEASLLLLAADGSTPARRAVVVAEARARPVEGPGHPATVVLTAPLSWSAVDCVLADDVTAVGRVERAAVLVGSDQDRAVERLERDQLGWFGPSEL